MQCIVFIGFFLSWSELQRSPILNLGCTWNMKAHDCECQMSSGVFWDHVCSFSHPRGLWGNPRTWRGLRHDDRTVAAALLCRVQQLQTVRAIYIYYPMKSLRTLLKTNCWPCRQKTCYKVSYQIHHSHIFPSNFWRVGDVYHEISWTIMKHPHSYTH